MSKLRRRKTSEIPVIPYDQCVAKTTEDHRPGLSVEDHCTYVGAVAKELMKRLPSNMQEQIPQEAPALIAPHDIGKVSPGFAKRIFSREELERRALGLSQLDNKRFEKDHAVVSEAALLAYYQTRGDGKKNWERWGEVLGNHHGGRRKYPDGDTKGKYGGYSWAKERQILLERLLDIFGNLPPDPPTDEQIALLSGMTCVSDWIGSDTNFFPAEGLPEDVNVFSEASKALNACGWFFPKLKFDLSFKEIFENLPYQSQTAFVETVTQPGLYVLEAPMGQGKTEAALYAAYRLMREGYHHGLYFALPTRLTSNRIHERVNRFLNKIVAGDQGANLIHGTAWLQLQGGGEELRSGNAWFHPSKRSLLWPFGVGTIDQALLSVLRVKHYFVRTFGLAGKIVILDEVHSYDVYTGTLLDRLVQTLLKLGCTVIILSATLTRERRASFFPDKSIPEEDAYPLITFDHQETGVKSVTPPKGQTVYTHIISQSRRELAELAVERAQQGQCVLWINNTIDSAQESYRAVLAERTEGAGDVGLLHSRFPVYRREELEDEWIEKLGKNGNRPNGCVLVATQVVEQSVDIDADFMISDLAPTDMMLQRAGRLWRHSERKRPCERAELYIVCPDLTGIEDAGVLIDTLDKSAKVYAPYILWQSYQVWKDRETVKLPNDIRGLLEATYVQPDGKTPEWIACLYEKLEIERGKLRSKALGSTAKDMPPLEDNENVATRYNTYPQRPALLIKSLDSTGRKATLTLADGSTQVVAETDKKNFKIAVALHKNLVNVPRYWVEERLKTPDYLKEHIYGDVAVLTIGSDGNLTGSNTYSLGYDTQKGIYKIADCNVLQ